MSVLKHHVLIDEQEGFSVWRRHGRPHGLADGYFILGISREVEPPVVYAIADTEGSHVFSSAPLSDDALAILASDTTGEEQAFNVFRSLIIEARLFRDSFGEVALG